MNSVHRIYFVPGLFGFGQLAGYEYFQHLRRNLALAFERRGHKVSFHEVASPPTSSLRERAKLLASTMGHTYQRGEELHILGHSTGGLDARLLLSDHTDLGLAPELLAFRPQVRSLLTLNTPHHGTPLASYFATVSGTRMLYALSLLTVLSLKLGEPSLAIFSRVLAGLGDLDHLLGGDFRLFSRVTDGLLRMLDGDRRAEISAYLSKVQIDQGAILQISPEAMDVFNAAVPSSEGVRTGCVLAMAPPPQALTAAQKVRSPYMAFTFALYSTLYQFCSQEHEAYEYPRPDRLTSERLQQAFGRELSAADNDGIVPSFSMLRGELIDVLEADHLDALGHFQDSERPALHTDWLTSGARLSRSRFQGMVERLAEFQLSSC